MENNESSPLFKIEDNLMMLHCIESNIRLLSIAVDDDRIASALYGIATVIDEQIHEIENKLGHTVST